MFVREPHPVDGFQGMTDTTNIGRAQGLLTEFLGNTEEIHHFPRRSADAVQLSSVRLSELLLPSCKLPSITFLLFDRNSLRHHCIPLSCMQLEPEEQSGPRG
jgi:hypothetical protein